ncbi:TetR/AcrR family transcriptional regulator [bacterium]|nr:TetR/AcrR family transcriptional regulator [bacterium]MBU1074282.1 TetR/AcrR family transcriptional regulator [bacterium]MBU1675088.1 TetR/AcrR family transcriptional regulator [bacterium]
MPLETTRQRPPAYDRKRLQVLTAAARVFSSVGYDKASMRRVAAEAQSSLAGIYHYIASKEELLYSIQLHTFDSLLRGLQNSLEGIVDPRQRLGAVVRNHVRHFGENMPELRICARELETLDGKAYDEVHDRRRSYFEAVHDLVKELRPRRDAPLRSWLATANLFGMLNWFYQWYDAERTRVSLDDLAAQQTALFLDGYTASASNDDSGGNE